MTVHQSRTAQLRSLTHSLELRLNHLTYQVSNLRHANIRGGSSRKQDRWELAVPALENRIEVLESSIEEIKVGLAKKVEDCLGEWRKNGQGLVMRAAKQDGDDGVEAEDEMVMRGRKRFRD